MASGWTRAAALAARAPPAAAVLHAGAAAALRSPARAAHIKKAEVTTTTTTSAGAEEDEGQFDRYYHEEELGSALREAAAAGPRGWPALQHRQPVEGPAAGVLRLTAGLGPPPPDGDPGPRRGGAALPGRPQVKLVGNMHGDETVSRQVLVYLARELAAGYRRGTTPGPPAQHHRRVYVLPSLNPDGFERAREGDCGLGDSGPSRGQRPRQQPRPRPQPLPRPVQHWRAPVPGRRA